MKTSLIGDFGVSAVLRHKFRWALSVTRVIRWSRADPGFEPSLIKNVVEGRAGVLFRRFESIVFAKELFVTCPLR